MHELKLTLKQEQPLINRSLERLTAELPGGARPIAGHVLAAGGKRLRPLLTVLSGRVLGCRDDRLYTLGAAVEMLHAATLLHDDILDHATERRGKPAAHTVYPAASVILAGDAMLAKALLTVSTFGDTRLTDCISEAVMRTAEGEIAEFACVRNPEITDADYLAVITGKTAWMLRASCELGALLSGAHSSMVKACADFGLELGIAFQMVDDALDFAAGTGKPRGNDVREGKITPPLLSYIAALSDTEAASFKARFSGPPLEDAEADALCEAVCAGGHAGYARDRAAAHLAAAGESLKQLPAAGERVVMEQMLEYVLTREH